MNSVFQLIAANRVLIATWHQQRVIFSIEVENLSHYSVAVIKFCDFLPYKIWRDLWFIVSNSGHNQSLMRSLMHNNETLIF